MGRNDPGHGLGGVLHVVEDRHKGLGGLGRRHQLENGLGNDAQCALGLDQHARQIVAGDAFHRTRAGFDHLARGVEKFDAHEVILGHAVLEAAQAARVLGDIAADGGHGLGARIRRIEEIFLGHGGGEVSGDHARFHHSVEVIGIDLQDAVQAGGQDHHGIAVVRNGAAGQVGARAAHGHGNAVVIKFLDAEAQLLGGRGPEHHRRNHGFKHRRVK